MTWSLHVRNGDLNIGGPGGFEIVTGQQKLVQDLRHALLSPRGSDPFNADYGANIDGGSLPDGTPVDPIIGGLIDAETTAMVEAEIRRVLNNYQQSQTARLGEEVILYAGRNTFDAGEILASVDAVDIVQVADTLLVRISITSADGNNISFIQPITA